MDCRLYPHKRIDIASIQEVTQYAGWHITAFNIPSTWSYTAGDGVTIAVLDTGCDLTHPDLVGNLLDGYNVINPDKPAQDDNDHGSHITGTICAQNNSHGVVGVSPKAKVIPVKVLDASGVGEMKNVSKGIQHALERKADIICLSLGSVKPLASVRNTIKKAESLGIPVFCAGGNISKAMDALYPARYPETIAIAALDKNYKRANFSNTRKYNLDFLAPGVEILSTVRHGWYSVFSGSSMAVPFAAACAALALSAKRMHNLSFKLDTVENYREVFRQHSLRPTTEGGFGIIDPSLMVEWIQSSQSP